MKFFQKTGVAVAITVLAIAAALFIGLSPVLKSGAETAPVQTVSSQDTSAQTSSASLPASESTASGTAGDETISNKYIRDEAGLFTRSAENTIKDYNDKIYSKTGSHVAILTTADTGGMSLEGYTNSAFDAMGLSEYDMLFSVDTDTQTWYVTTGAYVADFADSRLESIFKDGFAAILDTDTDEAAKDLYKDLYSWCKSNLTGAAAPQAEEPPAPAGEADEPAPDPDAGKHAFEVFCDCLMLDENLIAYLIDVLKANDRAGFYKLSQVTTHLDLDPDEFLYWLAHREDYAETDEERACAVILDACLNRLRAEGQMDVAAALLSGDRMTFDALRCEAPELRQLPVATYVWFEKNYLDRDYPLRFVLRCNGVEFPETLKKEP